MFPFPHARDPTGNRDVLEIGQADDDVFNATTAVSDLHNAVQSALYLQKAQPDDLVDVAIRVRPRTRVPPGQYSLPQTSTDTVGSFQGLLTSFDEPGYGNVSETAWMNATPQPTVPAQCKPPFTPSPRTSGPGEIPRTASRQSSYRSGPSPTGTWPMEKPGAQPVGTKKPKKKPTRLDHSFAGRFERALQHPKDTKYREYRYSEHKPAPKDTCGNCNKQGHVLADCAHPSTDGYVHGCPVCNTRTHEYSQCPYKLNNAPKSLERMIDWAVRRRANKPALAAFPFWVELIAQVGGANTRAGWVMPTRFPWRPAFVKDCMARGDEPWERFDYQANNPSKLPSDPLTGNEKRVIANRGEISQDQKVVANAPLVATKERKNETPAEVDWLI